MGGPYFDPVTQMSNMFQLPYTLGVITRSEMLKYNQALQNPEEFFPTLVHLYSMTPFYNYDLDDAKDPGVYNHGGLLDDVMNSRRMRDNAHVGKCPTFKFDTDDIPIKTNSDRMLGVTAELSVIMDNYKVLIYNGDYDVITSTYSIEQSLMALPWKLQEEYNNSSSREVWKGEEVQFNYSPFGDKGGYKVKGYFTKVGDFCRVILHKAGHQATGEQLENSLHMLKDFVFHGCIHRER